MAEDDEDDRLLMQEVLVGLKQKSSPNQVL
ncbi:hypothetical protein PLAN_30402 [Planktothrix rubescens CCAP 1459/22]|uniref:Uncharacterized protein n=1 Tax=Planktothrix rubescens CCAP 1459/22 TaxID=329571 RepID=A0A6J7ZH32_PLARU|nr:hypothetical protein PLAN_30402 [Planktothrix rubescens NIVA-CYA 18]